MVWRFALRSLVRRPVINGLLVLSLGFALGLPFAIGKIVASFGEQLEHRSEQTPLVLGAAGSKTDLVFHSLFFSGSAPGDIAVADWQTLDETRDGRSAPLFLVAKARRFPVIGTNGKYFRLRDLRLADGNPIARLGEAVVGADVAASLQLTSSSQVLTDIESLFTLSGGVPARLQVTGTMARTGTPDDRAIFVSLETAWLIAGLGHSHSNPTESHGDGDAPRPDAGVIEVTEENIDRFHFHGRRERFPLSAVLVQPDSAKSRLLLVGRYLDRDDAIQLVEADRTLSEFFSVALRLQRMFQANAAMAGAITVLLSAAVIALTIRLRWSEVTTLSRIGFSRKRIALLFGVEFAVVLVLAAVAAAIMSILAGWLAPSLLLWFVG